MNLRLLSKILGMLLVLLSVSMSVCLLFSILDKERSPGLDPVEGFLISIAISMGTGLVLMIFGRGSGKEIFRREAIAIVGLGWLFCSFFGALPYVYCEPRMGIVDALFESTSGFTTTGSTIIMDLNQFPKGILLWRSLSQWLGGMGILVLFVALLSYLGVGSKAIFRHESSAKHGGGLQTKISDVAMILWKLYLGMSVICCLGLYVLGMNFFDAVCHTFTTLSTGGFSPYNESIAYFNSVGIELWLTLFMILSGISFMLYAWLLRRRWDRWKQEEETKYYIGIICVLTAIISINLIFGTSRFTTGDIENLPALVTRLSQPEDTVSIYIRNGLEVDTLEQIDNFYEAETDLLALKLALTRDLNRIIQNGASIYEAEMFEGVLLREKTEMLLEESPQSFKLVRLNRQLLEDAYPTELSRELHYGHAVRGALFQVASILTTTGFATEDFNEWPIFSKIVILLMMMIGGCAGSTSGGIKISRWLLFFKTARIELVSAFRPNQIFNLRLNGKSADESLKLQTAFFIAIAGVVVAFGVAFVAMMEPYTTVAGCASAVMATLFNIGPGLGVVGPLSNFAEFSALTKLFLTLLMILGRLEFFAILVLFLPSLWKKY